MLQVGEEVVETRDGQKLFMRSWQPARLPARGIVQIVHGMAEHGGRYAPVAEPLSEAGYAVYAADHRGHGRSADDEDGLGAFAQGNGWTVAVSDIDVVGELARRAHPESPLCLLGHSMGSFLAQSYVIEHGAKLQGLVLSATNVGGGALVAAGRLVARLERLRQGPTGRSAILELLSFRAYNKSFEPTRTEADWLSRDSEQVDIYIRDPLCGYRSTNQLWIDLLDALHALGHADLSRIPKELPIYLFSGQRDPVSAQTKGVRKLVQAYQAAGLRDVTYRFYPDARHECFNEINRKQVIDELIAWLDGHVAASPSA